MWICSRVGKRNSLAVLRQLKIYGTRYKIEKIQKLTENFEKACWRSVRVAEERAYMQKYHFLRHCVNVIDRQRHRGSGAEAVSQPGPDRLKLSQYILSKNDLFTNRRCLEAARRIVDKVKSLKSKDPKQPAGEVTLPGVEKGSKITVAVDRVHEEDIEKLKNIIRRLEADEKNFDRNRENPDQLGYTRAELERMVKL